MLLALAFVQAPSAAYAQFSESFDKPQETAQIAGGLYAFRQGAYRSIFLVSDTGVIVTDPSNPRFAKAYRKEIDRITDKPVKYLVYSHSHWDRTAGGRIFKEEGARFVAHEQCVVNLRQTPHPDVIMPDITYADTYSVRVGNQALDLYYFGPSHDTCMSVIVAQPANMMFIVNIVNPPSASVPWNPTIPHLQLHSIIPWFKSVEDLARREAITSLVGGYISFGIKNRKPFLQPATGPIEAVLEQRIFWETLMAAVEKELAAGTGAKEIINKIDLAQFSGYPAYSKKNLGIIIRRVASLYITGR
jgi:hypothetical protein